MKVVGDGRKAGRFTGLRVVQFANAVMHSLCSHKAASVREEAGVELPIDQDTWCKVFEDEFPARYRNTGRSIQSLLDYCAYYNGGTQKLGYDKRGQFDFGTGDRDSDQGKGMSVAGTNLAVHPGQMSHVAPMQAITLAKQLWETHRRRHNPEILSVESVIRQVNSSHSSAGWFQPGLKCE